jgi:purine-nucleoside/S-methyl-5'-thioadenosine phosphorylase / adenosine deaminase
MLVLQSDNLSMSGIAHGFFGRTGGVSTGIYESLNCGPGSGDVRTHVIENRSRVCAALGVAALVNAGQIHGTHVVSVSKAWPIGETPDDDKKFIPLGDALVTATPGIALGILTADCAPVLFADASARVIGAAHAGWRGAIGGVVRSTLAAMEELGADRRKIAAAIGPCIAQESYEVGAELRQQFLAENPGNADFFVAADRQGHFRFDLEAYVAERLRAAGVKDIVTLSADTYARETDFFSFRRGTHRGEQEYGRQISAIALT